MFARLATVLLALSLVSRPLAAQITIGDASPEGRIGFSGPVVAGETFHTPDAVTARLDAFTYYVSFLQGRAYQLLIEPWDVAGQVPAGTAIFTSALQTQASGAADALTPLTFLTGGVVLDPALQYIALLSSPDETPFGIGQHSASYSGGRLYFKYMAFTAWDFPSVNDDAQFSATFNVVGATTTTPEPAGLVLLGTGLLGLTLRCRQRAS